MSYKVFVSYSWSNSAERRALSSELSELPGVDLLVDRDFIKPGDPVHGQVLAMIDAADCVVVFLTSEGLDSSEVRDELSRAHDRGKLIIPVVLAGTPMERLPWHIRETSWISYDERNFDAVVSAIAARIRGLADPLSVLDEAEIPANITELLQSGSRYVNIASHAGSPSLSGSRGDRILCGLKMRQSDATFVFSTHPQATIEDTAEALVRKLLPHLRHQDYEWVLVKDDRPLPPDFSLLAANVRSGDVLLLLGNHRRPRWMPHP